MRGGTGQQKPTSAVFQQHNFGDLNTDDQLKFTSNSPGGNAHESLVLA
jgi:hypothetical protein